MIGNDVVDLGDADSRVATHHARFDARVLAPSERDLIPPGPRGERVRWLLWAAKESAYKAARRIDAATVFSPPRFVVRIVSETTAVVDAAGRTFEVALRADDEHVHAVARPRDEAAGTVYSAVARLASGAAETPSAAVRRITVSTLAGLLGIPERDLAVDREGRVPCLRVRGQPDPAALSLSHHGRFIAFACRWPGGPRPA